MRIFVTNSLCFLNISSGEMLNIPNLIVLHEEHTHWHVVSIFLSDFQPQHSYHISFSQMSHQALECHNARSYHCFFMLCSRRKLASLYRCLTFFSRHHGGLSLLPQLLAQKNIPSFCLKKKNGFKGQNSSRSACLQRKYFADLVIRLVKY